MLDASRIRLVSEKLQAFYVYEGIMKRDVDFFPLKEQSMGNDRYKKRNGIFDTCVRFRWV